MVKKNRKNFLKSFIQEHQVWSAVGILFGTIVSLWVIASSVYLVQAHFERNKFLQAKADLAIIYNQITAEVGVPDAHETSQSCHYTSEIYSKGKLSCKVSEYVFYQEASEERALRKAQKIQANIESNQLVSESSQYGKQTLNLFRHSLLLTSFKIRDFETCGTSYYFNDQKGGFELPKEYVSTGMPGLSFSIVCQQSAKKEYFPQSGY